MSTAQLATLGEFPELMAMLHANLLISQPHFYLSKVSQYIFLVLYEMKIKLLCMKFFMFHQEEALGHTKEITSLSWPGNSSVFPQISLRR